MVTLCTGRIWPILPLHKVSFKPYLASLLIHMKKTLLVFHMHLDVGTHALLVDAPSKDLFTVFPSMSAHGILECKVNDPSSISVYHKLKVFSSQANMHQDSIKSSLYCGVLQPAYALKDHSCQFVVQVSNA